MLPKSWRWLKDYAAASERLVIGLISGTSADGVDAALVKVVGDKPKRVETLAFTTLPYPAEIRKTVLEVSHDGDIETLCWLNFALGELFAEAALKVIEVANIDRKRVQLVGSHGQTVRHLPPNRKLLRHTQRFPRWHASDCFARRHRNEDRHSCGQRFSGKRYGCRWTRCTVGAIG
jgi:1,6-anhydro-N-acetylmuramate kinase